MGDDWDSSIGNFADLSIAKLLSERANFPLLPGETSQTANEHVRAIIADPRVQVELATSDEGIWDLPITCGPNPSSFEVLSQTTREVRPDAFVAPAW